MKALVVVGDNCIDYYTSLNKAYPGGNAVNVGVYFSQLGGEASYVGVVGNDDFGELMKNSLNEKGVKTNYLKTMQGNTAVTKVNIVDGDRVFGDYDEGVMQNFKLGKEELIFIKSHQYIHSGIWGMVESYLSDFKDANSKVSFDFADKLEHEITELAIPHVDYAFFSYHENNEYIKAFMKDTQQRGPKIVIVTLGDKGSIAFDGNKFYVCQAREARVVDTLGAGDSYIAGFLYGIMTDLNLEECMELGSITAAKTISYFGAW